MTKDEKIAQLERRVAELTNVILTMEDFAREASEASDHVLTCVKSARTLELIGANKVALR